MEWNEQPSQDAGEGEESCCPESKYKHYQISQKKNQPRKIEGHRVIREWHLSVPLVYGGGMCNEDGVKERKAQERLDRARRTSMEKGLNS